jgi:hypothetical protein
MNKHQILDKIRRTAKANGRRQVVISWPSSLPEDEVGNIKDWLKIVEKKIAKSGVSRESVSDKPEN